MRNTYLTFLLYFTFINFSIAQFTFQKTYGGSLNDVILSVKQTADSGFIATGFTSSFSVGSYDVYVIRTNSNGDTLWTKSFGGTLQDVGYSIIQTSDNGFVVTGQIGDFGAGSYDVFLSKIDSSGNLIWSKTYGTLVSEKGYCVLQTPNGGFTIIGQQDILILHTDSQGNLLWSNNITSSGFAYKGVVDGIQTFDGGYALAGHFFVNGTSNPDMLIVKTDTLGNPVWAKTYGGTLNDEYAESIQQTPDSGFIIAGSTVSFGAGSRDFYLVKTDKFGNEIWSKTYGGTNDDRGLSVQITTDGGYIMTGTSQSFAGNSQLLLKLDYLGNLIWSKKFSNANTSVGDIQNTFDGGYIIAADNPTSLTQAFLIKTDSLGNAGCNQSVVTPTVTTPSTVTTTQSLISAIINILDTTFIPISGHGGIITTLCSNVGINDISTDDYFSISPNPTIGKLKVQLQNIFNTQTVISISNLLGEKLQDINLTEEITEIELNYPKGVYFMTLQNSKQRLTKKIILQ